MCQNQKPRVSLLEPHNLGRDVFDTTPLFWDCECERDYIHSCTEQTCPVCKAEREDAPDARVDEVFKYSTNLDRRLVDALTALCEVACPDLIMVDTPF
jgi:hypothetical protein